MFFAKKTKLILMGGGKLACMIYSTFRKHYNFVGYIDDKYDKALIEEHYGIKKLGTSKDIQRIALLCKNIIMAISSEGDNSPRMRYIDQFLKAGFDFPTLVAPSAIVADKCCLGRGCIIQHHVVIDDLTHIGDHCLVASNSTIRHNVKMGDNVVIAPSATVNGDTEIGDGVFLGTGSIVIQRVKVGKNALVGAGAVVIRDVPQGAKVVGVPAKEI